jgi:hypothetical protein
MATTLLTRLILSTVFITSAQFSAAQGLKEQVVELEPGKWVHQQKIYMAGNEVSQGSFRSEECVSEAEAELTIAYYIQKFLDGVGPDLVCSVTNLSGTSGDITADVSCIGDKGTATEMTLNYKYRLRSVEVSGKGWSKYGSHTVPFEVVASSVYLGDCP